MLIVSHEHLKRGRWRLIYGLKKTLQGGQSVERSATPSGLPAHERFQEARTWSHCFYAVIVTYRHLVGWWRVPLSFRFSDSGKLATGSLSSNYPQIKSPPRMRVRVSSGKNLPLAGIADFVFLDEATYLTLRQDGPLPAKWPNLPQSGFGWLRLQNGKFRREGTFV